MKIQRRKLFASILIVAAIALLNVGITTAIVDITLFNTQNYVYPGLGVINLVQLQTVGQVNFTFTSTGANIALALKNPSPTVTITANMVLDGQNGTATPVQVGSTTFTLTPGQQQNEQITGTFSHADSLGLLLT